MTQVEPKKCAGVEFIDFDENIYNKIDFIKECIDSNKAVIVKNVIEEELIGNIRDYLFNVGTNSLPSYHPLKNRIPDHHLILNKHPDSTIESYVHKFYFFPWNQNIFNFFERFKDVFQIKNLITGLNKEEFFKNNPVDDDFVLRCVFHHYPIGGGMIAKHADTIGVHQAVTAIVALSTKGKDFSNGGLYVINENDEKVFIDDHLTTGNVLFFNPEIEHGVDNIEGKSDGGFFDELGRWIMIAATIKTERNKEAKVAIQLD